MHRGLIGLLQRSSRHHTSSPRRTRGAGGGTTVTTIKAAEVSSLSMSSCHSSQHTSSLLMIPTSSSILHVKRCNSSTKRLSSSSLSSNKGGTKSDDAPTLFGLPNLRHPQDFIRLANDAIRECNDVRYALASSLSHPPSSSSVNAVQQAKLTLHRIDDISNIVCTVIDAAELCRSVHAGNAWRQAANDAFGILSEYIGNLNADAAIYKSLIHFVFADDGDSTTTTSTGANILSKLPREYRRMAIAMRREFERDGIHLQYTERETARELNNVIVGLESLFTSNITSRIKFYDVTNHERDGMLLIDEVNRIIPRHILGQLVRCPSCTQSSGADSSGSGGNDKERRLTLSSDNLLCNTLLAHSPSQALRKEIYMQSNTSVPENIDVLDALIKHRHVHSTLLGYPSYAHRVLSDRMVGSPEKVMEFLSDMENRAKHVYKTDMELIASTKCYMEGSGSGSSVVEPWDIPYYTTLLKAKRQHQRWTEAKNDDTDDINSDNKDYDESSQFARYFTVENSIEGMKILVQELFNITMEEVSIPIEERWDVADTTTTDTASNNNGGGGGLRKFIFHHDEDGTLGTMFFDLHPRDGKFLHVAHFTIRCGRRRNEEDSSMVGVDSSSDHQLPIVALVCNLSPSSEESSGSTSSQTQLSHAEVETLYHEFGHGLHSMLSRTSFQHLSGTRAAMDFVETPSHIFESFARDPSFLSRVLARHFVTGRFMSLKRAKHLALSNLDFRGIEIQTQIVHSKFDQALFGTNPCSVLLGGQLSTEVFERLHRDAGIPYATGTHWHSRFGHLVTYGAGYYGYLYAQTFAADIWMSTLGSSLTTSPGVSDGALRREGGTKIWKEMLIHGGAKDPKEMIRALLGREPSVDPFFKGIV